MNRRLRRVLQTINEIVEGGTTLEEAIDLYGLTKEEVKQIERGLVRIEMKIEMIR